MPDDFRRVQPGQKLSIPARAWNAAMEAAEAYQRNKHGGGAGNDSQLTRNPAVVTVKNKSGTAVKQFGVLGIDGALFPPAENSRQFQNFVAFAGVTPTDTHKGKFVILLEPAAPNAIVRAVLAGGISVRVDFQDASDKFADVKPGSTDQLLSGSSGPARILYKEGGSDIGTWWAVVAIGSGGNGDVRPVN
jgi:hypothetical protein